MTDRNEPTTEELRRRLAAQARQAPTGDFLAERVIAQAEASSTSRRRLPWVQLMAVAAAVLAVAGIAVAVTRSGDEGDGQREQAAQSTPVAPPTTLAPLMSSSSAPPASPSSASPQSGSARRITVPTLDNVRVVAITFTGGGDGWALASADCLTSSGRCTALLHTSDGGVSWQGRPNTPFQVPGVRNCSSPCVTDLRFATDDIGYAFGRDALFLTTDGAKHWQRLGGGADALETLDGNVIRVSSAAGSCPPGCDYTVRVADVGSRTWRDVDLPGPAGAGDAVVLSRTGDHAYLLVLGNPAGGAGRATSTLYTSSNDGASWHNKGEPCMQDGGEVDSRTLTTAADGTVAVVCAPRGGGSQSVATSADGGRTFTGKGAALGSADVTALGAAGADTLLVSSDATYRSTDGGARFERTSLGRLSYLGFASDKDVHAVDADGRTVYTSTDAGRTWQVARFA